jgi:hypothetical protein
MLLLVLLARKRNLVSAAHGHDSREQALTVFDAFVAFLVW